MTQDGSARHNTVAATTGEKATSLNASSVGEENSSVFGLATSALNHVAQTHHDPSDMRADIDLFVDALIDPDPKRAVAAFHKVQSQGMAIEPLYLEYLAGSARRLGDRWTEDLVSFSTVSVGVSRIYGLIRSLDRPVEPHASAHRPKALFAALPGETHTLGLRMAADLFRRRDWDIELVLPQSDQELMSRFEGSDHRLVGLSGADTTGLADLERITKAMRKRKPQARILISGALAQHPSLRSSITVDAVAQDFEQAFAAMTELWRAAPA
ncbi:MAG: cobalamin B12-binding domain-containing protein [Pseudomonadota bacterium]